QSGIAMLFLRRHGGRYGDIDMRPRRRRVGEVDSVDVVGINPGRIVSLRDVGEARTLVLNGRGGDRHRLIDDDLALRRPRHAEVDAVGDETVIGRIVGRDPVVAHAAGAVDVARYHVTGDVARDVDGVVAEATDSPHRHAWRRAEHVDSVVALERID